MFSQGFPKLVKNIHERDASFCHFDSNHASQKAIMQNLYIFITSLPVVAGTGRSHHSGWFCPRLLEKRQTIPRLGKEHVRLR